MKNYLNKGLFYKEWKSIMGLSILFFINTILFVIVPFINSVSNLKENISTGNIKSNDYYLHFFTDFFINNASIQMICISTLILIGAYIVGIDIAGKRYDSLEAMPFKREEIILTKWIVSALTVIIPLTLSFIAISIVYTGNKEVLSSYMNMEMIAGWFLMDTLLYLFVVSFIMLIQVLSGKIVIGGVVGTIFLMLPMGLGALTEGFIRVFSLNPNILSQEKSIAISNSAEKLWLNSSLVFYNIEDDNFVLSLFQKGSILTVATVIVVALMVYAFVKIPLERNGYIVIFKPLEVIFKIGVSVCFGLLGGLISSQFLSEYFKVYLYVANPKNLETSLAMVNKTISLTVLFTFLIGGIVYLIINKVVDLSKK